MPVKAKIMLIIIEVGEGYKGLLYYSIHFLCVFEMFWNKGVNRKHKGPSIEI